MNTILIVVVIAVTYYLYVLLPRKQITKTEEREAYDFNGRLVEKEETDYKISEEKIILREQQFDKHFETRYLPDSPSSKQLYTYKHLMKPWYGKLSSKHRYNEEIVGKIRKDWYDYMYAVDEENSGIFVSMEFYSSDKEKSDEYRVEAEQNGRKRWAIEDGFAATVGEDAVKELSRIRGLNSFDFEKETGELNQK